MTWADERRSYLWRSIEWFEVEPWTLELLWVTGSFDGPMAAVFWHKDHGMIYGRVKQSPYARGERFFWLYKLTEDQKRQLRMNQWGSSASYYVSGKRILELGLDPILGAYNHRATPYDWGGEENIKTEDVLGFIGWDNVRNRRNRRYVDRQKQPGCLPDDEEAVDTTWWRRVKGWFGL